MMKYEIRLYLSQYKKICDEWQTVEVSSDFTFSTWDDVQNFIGYLVEGADGGVKFEIKTKGIE